MTQTITPSLRHLRTRPIPGMTAGAVGIPSCAPPGYPTATAKPKLLDQVREAIRTRHYSYRTEEAYVGWIRRYILFHGKRHPREMGKEEVSAFLTALAVQRNVSASTQNQALAAILFLYRDVLECELGWLDDVVRAKRPQRLPVVLARHEVQALLAVLDGVAWVVAMLLFGSGLRLMECLRLRVKDVEFDRHEVVVREGKGDKDRVTMLPSAVVPRLRAQLERVRSRHASDVAAGFGRVALPDALARKSPNADRDWAWQWVFPRLDPICRSADRGAAPPPPARVRSAARHSRGEAPCGNLEAGRTAHLEALLRDASARSGLRHPDRSGAPRSSGRENDDDLHSCAQARRPRRPQPCRRAPPPR